MGKIGARFPDLIPRIVVCIGNLIKNTSLMHSSVVRFGHTQLRILQHPSLGGALLEGDRDDHVPADDHYNILAERIRTTFPAF